MTRTEYHSEFEKTLIGIARRWHLWQVFSDFCEISAIALYNPIFHDYKREQKYRDIVSKYNLDEIDAMVKLFTIVVKALESKHQDFLGEMFMQLELGSHWRGQFFTPYVLCKMLASQQIDEATNQEIQNKGFITLSEPACGAGAMAIAFAEALKLRNINYQKSLHVTATDVDSTAAHMAYIQLSLLGIPAIVINGNTLTLSVNTTWVTPMHAFGFWDNKLHTRNVTSNAPSPTDLRIPELLVSNY